MAEYTTWKTVYHDSSTKGFRHGIRHKRHDCWRGEIWFVIDGKPVFRQRKRFKCPIEARQWTKDYSAKLLGNDQT